VSRQAVATTEAVSAAIRVVRAQGLPVQYERGRGVLNITRVHEVAGGDFYRVRAIAVLLLESEGARLTRRDRRLAQDVLARGGRLPDLMLRAPAVLAANSADLVRPEDRRRSALVHPRLASGDDDPAGTRGSASHRRGDDPGASSASRHLLLGVEGETSGMTSRQGGPDISDLLRAAKVRRL
jgi:hypothetical protein